MQTVRGLTRSRFIECLIAVTAAWLFAPAAYARAEFVSDRSFGDRSVATAFLGSPALSATVGSRALLVDGRGRIVAGAANGGEWRVRRFLRSGGLDSSFGNGGEVVITAWGGLGPIGDSPQGANLTSGVIRPNGRILLVGYVGSYFSGGTRKGTARMVMTQLMPDGSPDRSFGLRATGNGGQTWGVRSGAADVALRPDGRFVISGFRQLGSTGPSDDGAIIGFTAKGRRDPSFSGGQTKIIPGAGLRNSYLLDIEVLSSGRIVATGANQNRITVVKLRQDGSFDRSFGRRGRIVVDPGGSECRCSIGRAMDVDKEGRIIVTGHVIPPDVREAGFGATLRFGKDGRLDRSFGSGGITRIYATPRRGRYTTNLYDTTIDSEGRIWVAGSAGPLTRRGREAVAVRYLPSGRKDPKFFRRGVLRIRLGEASVGWAVARAGRKIYLSGRYDRTDDERFFIKRFTQRR